MSLSYNGCWTSYTGLHASLSGYLYSILHIMHSRSVMHWVYDSLCFVQPVIRQSEHCAVVNYVILTECHPLCSARNVTVTHPISHGDVILQRTPDVLSRVSVTVLAVTKSSHSSKSSKQATFDMASFLMMKSNKMVVSSGKKSPFEYLYTLRRRTVDLLEFRRKDLVSAVIPGATNINVSWASVKCLTVCLMYM